MIGSAYFFNVLLRMSNVSAVQVKALRDRTGVAMLACKKALEEAGGDEEKALEILRKRGEAKAAEKSDRTTGEGAIAIVGRSYVALLCETDFVARNADFLAFAQELAQTLDAEGAAALEASFEAQKTDKIQAIGENIVLESFGTIEDGDTVGHYVHSNNKVAAIVALQGGTPEAARDVAMHVTAMNPSVANPEDVAAEEIEKEKAIARETLEKEGKPAEIIEKILEGKIRKFCAERALTTQDFVKNPEQTVDQYLDGAKVVGFLRIEV